jgi:hypothetical protein
MAKQLPAIARPASQQDEQVTIAEPTDIFLSPSAQRVLQPGMEAIGPDTQAAAHRPHRELLAMLGNKRVYHFASLAKYAVAFFKMSRS